MFIIGIDPGTSGGFAIIDDVRRKLTLRKMPDTPKEIFNILNFFLKASKGEIFVYIEKVQGLPGMGGSSMFNFGKNSGHLEMAMLALNIPFEQLTPQKWQKEFQLGTKGNQTTSVWKNKLKNKAEQLFPDTKMFLWGSDATLIAEYGRRIKK